MKTEKQIQRLALKCFDELGKALKRVENGRPLKGYEYFFLRDVQVYLKFYIAVCHGRYKEALKLMDDMDTNQRDQLNDEVFDFVHTKYLEAKAGYL